MNNSTKESILEVSHGGALSPTSDDVRSSERGEATLPCLYRNNSTEISHPDTPQPNKDELLKAICVDKKYRKTSTALSANVIEFSVKYGLEKLGFLTLTFADHVTCYKEASKRFNSLATHVLNHRYKAFIKVMERQKSGRIHYHLIVALDNDIRSGFKFSDVSNGNYKSAGAALRAEWSFWRLTAKKYRFGRTELLPIKSNHEAIGRYVGKYIGKHMLERLPEDKGARLVSYSKGCRVMNTKFSWVSSGASEWRAKVRVFAHLVSERTGCEPTFDGLRQELGTKWAYNNREFIAGLAV
jgi:hypothetical protein